MAIYFPSLKWSFHSISEWMQPHFAQAYVMLCTSPSASTVYVRFPHSNGCNSPQLGQGTFHSSIVECSYSISIRDTPFMVGVLVSTSLRFQYVVKRFPASIRGSPSAPAVGGYASISSASRTRIGRLLSSVGEFAPVIVIRPPGNAFLNIVFPLVLLFSFILSLKAGVSLTIGISLSLLNVSASDKVGCIQRIVHGS